MASRPLVQRDFAANDNDDGPTPPFSGIAFPLGRKQRRAIAERVEWLVALLDADDGDIDMEDDDPAGGDANDVGEAEDWRPEGHKLLLPVYDEDQSLGPINKKEVNREFHRWQLGLAA